MTELVDLARRAGLAGVRSDGSGGALATCPCHDDHEPSLHLWWDSERELAFYCHGGCDWAVVKERLEEIGLPVDAAPERRPAERELIATYDYTDERGELVYQVVRYAPKDFRQRRPDGKGGWRWNLKGTHPVLFRLPELIAGVAARETIFVTEGEKDALAVVQAGGVATCNSGGAGKWPSEQAEHLRGAKVVIIADRDEPGRRHAEAVAASLAGVAESVRIVEPLAGKDAHDHIAASRTLDELRAAGEPAPRPALPIHSLAELEAMELPKPEYLVAPPLALVRGTVVELDAYPKYGKTRLVLDAIWSQLTGSTFLGEPTMSAPVLYLTEEGLVTWSEALAGAGLRSEECGALDWMSLLELKREPGDWEGLCELLRDYCTCRGVGLLVVDTLARWAGVTDEDNAVEMAAAVMPLRLIAAADVAVLFLRHDRKGGGPVGQSGRGSSAATGEADHIVHLELKSGSGENAARQREIEAMGRLTGVTGKIVVELGADGHYRLVSDAPEAAKQGAREALLRLLPGERSSAWTMKECIGACDAKEATMRRALEGLIEEGLVLAEKGAGHAAYLSSRKAVGYWRAAVQQQLEVCASSSSPHYSPLKKGA